MDKALLEELYQRYGAELFRYLYAMCRDRLLAEDIMQDAFCRALISLPNAGRILPGPHLSSHKPCERPRLAVHGRKKSSDQ